MSNTSTIQEIEKRFEEIKNTAIRLSQNRDWIDLKTKPTRYTRRHTHSNPEKVDIVKISIFSALNNSKPARAINIISNIPPECNVSFGALINTNNSILSVLELHYKK